MEEAADNTPQKLRLLNLEKELAGPHKQEVFDQHDGEMAALQKRVMEDQRLPLPPEEYDRDEKLRLGIIAARKILKFGLLNS